MAKAYENKTRNTRLIRLNAIFHVKFYKTENIWMHCKAKSFQYEMDFT